MGRPVIGRRTLLPYRDPQAVARRVRATCARPAVRRETTRVDLAGGKRKEKKKEELNFFLKEETGTA